MALGAAFLAAGSILVTAGGASAYTTPSGVLTCTEGSYNTSNGAYGYYFGGATCHVNNGYIGRKWRVAVSCTAGFTYRSEYVVTYYPNQQSLTAPNYGNGCY
ncbi:hypothetical protein AMK27_36455 [Streptomyces sp. CB02009]|uniref:hypothetical protein n=1 Tax=Streptomyces sp. CB02009 TaxID=1703938 RepID=UPI00093C43F3|nr:hypothetical protein [Streptomyces sp. CB02009]OKJ49544.1 hypothetical protein AMK27_36455 [Streptomyces sp. CB02009]